MSNCDWDEVGPNMAKRLKETVKQRLIDVDSAKGNRITEALLSGTVDAYRAENPGVNAIFASAHQNSTHIVEQHPDIVYEDSKPDRDIRLSGGRFSLVGEQETSGGPQAVVHDFNKIKSDPIDELKLLATRAHSPKQRARYHDMLQKASEDGGCYIGIEIQLPKKKKSSQAEVDIICFHDGKQV